MLSFLLPPGSFGPGEFSLLLLFSLFFRRSVVWILRIVVGVPLRHVVASLSGVFLIFSFLPGSHLLLLCGLSLSDDFVIVEEVEHSVLFHCGGRV